MKKAGHEVAQLLPAPGGWRLVRAGVVTEGASLVEALNGTPADAPLHLSLPSHAVLTERLVLPSQDKEELSGMVELQLEKTLPYPLEEVTWGFSVLPGETPEEGHSTVLSEAVHTPLLETLCEPLRTTGRLPQRVSFYAEQIAAKGPAGELALMLWQEEGQVVAALANRQHLSWVQPLSAIHIDGVVEELPVALLGAEMQGVDTRYTQVLLAPECQELMPLLQASGVQRFGTWPEAAALPLPPTNLLPQGWKVESGRQERKERLRQRLLLAAVLYLTLLAAAFLYLAWRKHTLQEVAREVARIQPRIAATQAQQARWEAMAPAIDPARSAVNILFLVNRNRPSNDVRITVFDFSPAQFMAEGEAPSAALAIDFAERLRKEPELQAFTIEAGQPVILPNEHAQFRIFGKLQ